MSHSLHCTPTLHAALLTEGGTQYLGLELAAGDVVEISRCPHCDCELRRPLGIDVRLAQAQLANGGNGDQSMIGRCKRALSGDESAVRSWQTAVEFERLMGGAR